MNGHIAGVMDIYNKKTIGALFNIPLPGGLGDNNNSMLTNAADILNRGLEVSLRYNKNSKGKFNYSLGVNATFNHNEVLGLGNGLPTNFGSLRNGEFATRVATGQAIGSFWVYETQGVFQTQAEVDAVPHFLGTQPGDFKVIDQNKDGKINDLDRIYLGSYQPKCFMGMNGSFKYSNWDLNIDLLGNFGNKVFNGKKTVRYGGNYNIEKAVADARWTPTNGTNTAPRAFNGVPKPTDYFVESGSFVRLNNLTIGYNLPAKIAKNPKYKAIGSLSPHRTHSLGKIQRIQRRTARQSRRCRYRTRYLSNIIHLPHRFVYPILTQAITSYENTFQHGENLHLGRNSHLHPQHYHDGMQERLPQ